MKIVRCYWKHEGKVCRVDVNNPTTIRDAVWAGRQHAFGEKENWFEVKRGLMCVVDKDYVNV